ncbi:MAG TPA: hypothetical protein VJT32_07410 [bacterium]|nr:hypothetical protein [bacterium]
MQIISAILKPPEPTVLAFLDLGTMSSNMPTDVSCQTWLKPRYRVTRRHLIAEAAETIERT